MITEAEGSRIRDKMLCPWLLRWRGHKPRNATGLYKVEKVRKWIPPRPPEGNSPAKTVTLAL